MTDAERDRVVAIAARILSHSFFDLEHFEGEKELLQRVGIESYRKDAKHETPDHSPSS